MRLLFVLLCLLAPYATAASQAGVAAGATIEGDVYLVMDNGDTKKGAGREILLLPQSTTTKRDSICRLPFPVQTRVSDSLTNVARRSNDSAYYYLYQRKDTASAHRQFQAATKHEELAADARRSAEVSAEQRRQYALRQLFRTAIARAQSGMNAHYRFEGVQPGRYIIYGEWRIAGETYAWLAPLAVERTGHINKDLDNSVASTATLLSCR